LPLDFFEQVCASEITPRLFLSFVCCGLGHRFSFARAAAKSGSTSLAVRMLGQQDIDFTLGLEIQNYAGRWFG
jgi:hypothetical protein